MQKKFVIYNGFLFETPLISHIGDIYFRSVYFHWGYIMTIKIISNKKIPLKLCTFRGIFPFTVFLKHFLFPAFRFQQPYFDQKLYRILHALPVCDLRISGAL